ncbi:copper resistance protein NlpE [Campylobacter pinnipediorum]|uniref:copper resistance protein NlpE n=1 Tax=Campylobacter pinnipediorum TaxID=1965231 RepID=UPI0009AD6437|nr:copper resistance protein NlpE [Campylobacter pinnipediorum]
MKIKNSFLVVCAAALFAGCAINNSSSSMNNDMQDKVVSSYDMYSVAGVYKAVLPCASCEAIDTTLVLKNDGKFESLMEYKGGEQYTEKSSGTYNVKGDIVTVVNKYNKTSMFRVDNKSLKMLDAEGKEVTGPMAKFYVFKKM